MDIRTIISRIHSLPESSLEKLEESLTRVDRPKGFRLTETGKVESNVFFLSEGIARAYLPVDGKEVTFWIGAEGSTLMSMKSFVNGKAPKPDDLTGYEAVALENIAGSGYGKVRVKYNGLNYRFDAISVYHTDIESGEKVDIVTGEDELLFVQKKDEIYKVLDEEKTPVTKAETDITPEPKRKNDSFVSSEEINNNRKEE